MHVAPWPAPSLPRSLLVYTLASTSYLLPDHSNKQVNKKQQLALSSNGAQLWPLHLFSAESSTRLRPRAAAYHARSVSLPCHSHPLLAHLCTHIAAVRSWVADPISVSTGLAHLDTLHAALAELLLLPEARSALQHGSPTAACLLDGFLLLADAHGAFQETVVELRSHASEAQAALRRRDEARLASAVRSLRRAEKDLGRLAASVGAAAKSPTATLSTSSSAAEVEVSGALAEAVAAAACASAAVFSAVEAVSAAVTTALASKKTVTSSLMSLVKSGKASTSDEEKEVAALDRLEELEACMAEMKMGSERAGCSGSGASSTQGSPSSTSKRKRAVN